MTREQLGLDQEGPKVLRIPDGLESIGEGWFSDSDIEKLIVPNAVKKLGGFAFEDCKELREVVFEPDSRLEIIREWCFRECALEKIVIPKSVREIGQNAFRFCKNLRSLVFEEGSRLEHVGKNVLADTPLEKRK